MKNEGQGSTRYPYGKCFWIFTTPTEWSSSYWFRVVRFRAVNPQPYYAFLTALVKRPLRLCGVLLRLCAKQKDQRIAAKFLRFPRETKQVEVEAEAKVEVEVQRVAYGGECYWLLVIGYWFLVFSYWLLVHS